MVTEFSLLSLQIERERELKAAEKRTQERMSEIFLWNIFTLVFWDNQRLVFSGEMKRNRPCSKRFLPLLNSWSV